LVVVPEGARNLGIGHSEGQNSEFKIDLSDSRYTYPNSRAHPTYERKDVVIDGGLVIRIDCMTRSWESPY